MQCWIIAIIWQQLLWPYRFRRWSLAWGALLAGAVCRGTLAAYDFWLDIPPESILLPIAASGLLALGFYELSVLFRANGNLTRPAEAAIIEIDNFSMIVGWDQRAETIFGWSAAEAIGKTLMQTIIPPRDWEAHRAGLIRFLRAGEQGRTLNRLFAVNAMCKSGEEIAIVVQITPTPQADGTLHFVGRIHALALL